MSDSDDYFASKNVMMVPIKDRFDQEFWNALAFRAAGNLLNAHAKAITDGFKAVGAAAIQMGENMKAAFEQFPNVKV